MVWIPAFKTLLPYVTQIVSLAVPAFTRKQDEEAQELINQQIRELQDAATRNTESLKGLATQLQKAITDIDAGAQRIEQEIRKTRQLCLMAIGVSALAIALALIALVIPG